MSCAACQARVEKAVSQVAGVDSCAVSLLTNSMNVKGSASPSDVVRAVVKAGYSARLLSSDGVDGLSGGAYSDGKADGNAKAHEAYPDDGRSEIAMLKRRLVFSVAFLALLMYVTMGHNMLGWPIPSFFIGNHMGLVLVQALLSAFVMIVNRRFFSAGLKSVMMRSPNMDALVALGSGVSFAWSISVAFRMSAMLSSGLGDAAILELYHNELYFESAAMIPALITVGKLLEAISKGRTTDALKSLSKLQPDKARALRLGADGKEHEVEIDCRELAVGEVFIVRPGDRMPADGVVLEGFGAADESSLTGESMPVDKEIGSKVSAATLNLSGCLKCKAIKVGGDTSMSRIIRMVSDASSTKAPIARIADRVSSFFVPAVMLLSLAVLVGWIIAGAPAAYAVSRGICVLVISCPCALGLATPVAIMVGNGVGAKNGILIKTAEALENIGKIRTAMIDKTGTITEGALRVSDTMAAPGISEMEMMEVACALESKSSHPIAKAVVRECESRGIPSPCEVADYREVAGSGVEGTFSGQRVFAGNAKRILSSAGFSDFEVFDGLRKKADVLSESGRTLLYFAKDGKLMGFMGLVDSIKETSGSAIDGFARLGVRTVMLTGDNRKVAEYIGKQAGVDDIVAEVFPDEKAQAVLERKNSGLVAMIGDGINDAPALVSADVGIALGAGTDIAMDSADIILVGNDLADALACVKLGRAVIRNIRENLFWAFFYNIICMPLAAGMFGLGMNPMIGAAAMSLSSVTVCLNALRLNRLRIKSSAEKARNSMSQKHDSNSNGETGATRGNGRKSVMMKKINVGGMMCQHCEKNIQQALENLDFVEKAIASHENGTVELEISGEFDLDKVKSVVAGKGYEFKGLA